MLTVYIDFKSPDCYLALAPTLAMIEHTGCRVRWLPLRVRERELPKDSHDPALTASHGRVRRAYQQRINQHYASLQGLSLEGPTNPHGTDAALAALLGSEDDTTPFVQAAFNAYWRDGANLDSPQTVTKLWRSCLSQPASIDIEALDRHQADAETAGIPDAPAYVLGGELFIGRAHLPWLRELLTGS